MKGQFMLISAIIVGMMIISVSSTISEIQSESFEHDPDSYYLNMIKDEASKVDLSSERERESFKNMVDNLPGYRTETNAWDQGSTGSYDCFNVTLKSPRNRLEMRCIS